jgi:uncharacterized protein (DUF2252 family)
MAAVAAHDGTGVAGRVARANAGRDPELLRRKYAAMAADPVAFFRASCPLFFEDWAADADPALRDAAPSVWLCGDLHLENFGTFKGDNRLAYFDLNDFDQAALAPATWHLARFLTGLFVATRRQGVADDEAAALCDAFLDAYTAALIDGTARWVERATARGPVRDLLGGLRKRRRRDHLARFTARRGKRRQLVADGDRVLPIDEQRRALIADFMRGFAASQPDPAFFTLLDVARSGSGTGSLGLARYTLLVEGHGSPHRNYLLDLKEERPSDLVAHLTVRQPSWRDEAERVVSVQQWVQAISPAFLSAVQVGGVAFKLQALQPDEDKLDLARHWGGKSKRQRLALATMGEVVAWGQLRSGGRQGSATTDEAIAFARRDDWRGPLLAYARAYTERVERDWRTFQTELRHGALGSLG